MRDRKLQRAFQSIGLVESTSLVSNDTPPASHITGSKQICSAWLIPNMNPSVVCTFPHYFEVGDYRCMILDFLREMS